MRPFRKSASDEDLGDPQGVWLRELCAAADLPLKPSAALRGRLTLWSYLGFHTSVGLATSILSLLAFTQIAGDGLHIGVIAPSGSDERILTAGPQDEGPSWAASGRDLLFQHYDAGGRTELNAVSVDGGSPRRIVTPQDGSDPDWSVGAK